jgi:hypothetical protein
MTPDTFRTHLAALQWTQRGLADMIRIDERQVRRWAAGAAIPPHIAAWIERAAAELAPHVQAIDEWHAKNPPPPKIPVAMSADRGL